MQKLESVRGLILDMDGVLWLGDQPIGDLPAAFERIRQLELKTTLVTNNASRSVSFFLEKLRSFEVELEDWQVISSGHALVYLLKKDYPNIKRLFLMGEQGLEELLAEEGYQLVEQDAEAVVVSLDRQVTYDKLRQGSRMVRDGALLIATNRDPTLPRPDGLDPGAGVMVVAMETASGVNASFAGKPMPYAYQLAIERMGISPTETLVVGDRLATDIAGAQELGCPTALVLSGVSTVEDARNWSPEPDLVVEDLSAVLELLSSGRFT